MQMSENSSTSDSSTDSPRWQISVSFHGGAYEDCTFCNEGIDHEHSNKKPLIGMGTYVDDDTDDNGAYEETNVKDEVKNKIDKNQIEDSQPESETDFESIPEDEGQPEEDNQETQSIGTDFTYDEIDPETGNITRHCPSSRPLHEFLWRGREFLREDNQHTYMQTPESCEQSIKVWAASIAYVRDEFITFDLCKKAVKKDGYAIRNINRNLLTPEEYYELALIAVKQNPFSFSEVPGDIQTQELCDVAVKSGCWALPYCYRGFRTPELCLSAVSRNGQTLKHVPEEHITYELCLAAINSGYECMEYIPKEYITPELCKAAVEASGRNIEHIPKEYITSEIGLIAVKTKAKHELFSMAGRNIRFIPTEHITKEIILEALRDSAHAYELIPKELLNDEIYEAILEVEPACIMYMPQTPKLIIKALKADIRIIQCIKKVNMTPEVAKYILSVSNIQEELEESSLDYLKALAAQTEDFLMLADGLGVQ